MQQLSKLSKFFLYTAAVFCFIWLGSYLSRIFLHYYIFQGTHFELNSYITNENIAGVLQGQAPAVVITTIAYPAFFLLFLLFIITSKLSFRINGWLFISTALLFVTMPFEAVLMYKFDRPFLQAVFFGGKVDGWYLKDLIQKRFELFSSFPIIEILVVSAMIFFFMFRPLMKRSQ
jgi:hypothetical protein